MNYKLYITFNRTGVQAYCECKTSNLNVSKEYHGSDWFNTHSAQWTHRHVNLPSTGRTLINDTAGITVKRGDQISCGWDASSGGASDITIEFEIDGVIVHKRIFTNVTDSCFTTFRVGYDQAYSPTYLETLDKLDQWSSAHYIPNGRNELNL